MINDNSSKQFRPPVPEETLKAAQLHIERKDFTFLLKENNGGRFLRIVEQAGETHSSLIVPSSGLGEFKRMMDEMVAAANQQFHQPKGHDVQ